MKKLKCIFIGFGKHAENYGKVCKYLNVEIRAVCVTNPKNYLSQKKNIK